MPSRDIAGSCGKSIPIFQRNNHTNFHSDCAILHSHQQWMVVPFPHTHTSSPTWDVTYFIDQTIVKDVKWNLKNSFDLYFPNDSGCCVEYFFKCSLAIWIVSFEIRISALFLIALLFLWYLEILDLCILFWILNLYCMYKCKKFSPFCRLTVCLYNRVLCHAESS